MTQLGKALDTAKANIAGARDGSSRGDEGCQMPITVDRVREIFKGLESGDGAAFFVRAYLDSAMVIRLFQKNPIPDAESRN
jgi:hypothetical protein